MLDLLGSTLRVLAAVVIASWMVGLDAVTDRAVAATSWLVTALATVPPALSLAVLGAFVGAAIGTVLMTLAGGNR